VVCVADVRTVQTVLGVTAIANVLHAAESAFPRTEPNKQDWFRPVFFVYIKVLNNVFSICYNEGWPF